VVVVPGVVEEAVGDVVDELLVVVVWDVVPSCELVVEGPLEPPIQPLVMTNPEIRKIRISNEAFLIFIPP
jgi:hypothetical protein